MTNTTTVSPAGGREPEMNGNANANAAEDGSRSNAQADKWSDAYSEQEGRNTLPSPGTPIRSHYESLGISVTFVPGNGSTLSSIIIWREPAPITLYEGVDYYFKNSSAIMGLPPVEQAIVEKPNTTPGEVPFTAGKDPQPAAPKTPDSGGSSSYRPGLNLQDDINYVRAKWTWKVDEDGKPVRPTKDINDMYEWITVEVWQIDGNGEKVKREVSFWVHKTLAKEVRQIFKDILADETSKFPIHEVWGGDYLAKDFWTQAAIDKAIENGQTPGKLNSVRYPNHPAGGAIDINWSWNLDSARNPSPYMLTDDCIVVKVFKQYGWTWGDSFNDWTHFSKLGG